MFFKKIVQHICTSYTRIYLGRRYSSLPTDCALATLFAKNREGGKLALESWKEQTDRRSNDNAPLLLSAARSLYTLHLEWNERNKLILEQTRRFVARRSAFISQPLDIFAASFKVRVASQGSRLHSRRRGAHAVRWRSSLGQRDDRMTTCVVARPRTCVRTHVRPRTSSREARRQIIIFRIAPLLHVSKPWTWTRVEGDNSRRWATRVASCAQESHRAAVARFPIVETMRMRDHGVRPYCTQLQPPINKLFDFMQLSKQFLLIIRRRQMSYSELL